MVARSLESVVACYVLARPLRRHSARNLGYCVGVYAAWLGREPTLDDLDRETLNRFLVEVAARYRPRSVKNLRASLLTVWRWAVDEHGLVEPRKIRRVPVPRVAPVAWSHAEVRRLLAAARRLPGTRRDGVPLRKYFAALILAAWDTGLRRSDLFALRRADLKRGGVVAITQSKTGAPIVRAMRPRTRAAVLALPGVVPLAWPGAPKNFYRAWRELRTTARVDGGAMQRLRRSSASEVERVTPGAAAAFLGHATPGLAERCYIDPRIAGPRPVSPTRLE